MAQENPYLQSDDGMTMDSHDENSEKYLAIRSGCVLYHTTKAFQEAQARVETLEAKVTTLEAALAALTERVDAISS